MKKLFFCIVAVLASASLSMAQNARGPYHTNKAGDNLFIGVSGGVSTLSTSTNETMFTPDFEITFGKWFTPSVGARIGYQGASLKEKYADHDFHEHFWMEPDKNGAFKYGFGYVHGDVMWNFINAIWGYKERVINVIPYLHAGYECIWNPETGITGAARDPEFVAGAGILATAKLTKRLALTADVRNLMFSERFHDWNRGGVGQVFTGSIGLAYAIGKTDWDRCSGNADLADAKAALAAAQAALAASEASLAAACSAADDLNAKVKGLTEENASLKAAVENAVPKNENDVVYVKTALGVAPLILYYDINVTELNATELRHLDDYVKSILAQDPDRKFTLTGSADKGTGTMEINTRLAAGRSAGVKKILMEKYNVKAENIVVKEGKVTDENADPRFDRSTIVEH